jgi:hypothetical protein
VAETSGGPGSASSGTVPSSAAAGPSGGGSAAGGGTGPSSGTGSPSSGASSPSSGTGSPSSGAGRASGGGGPASGTGSSDGKGPGKRSSLPVVGLTLLAVLGLLRTTAPPAPTPASGATASASTLAVPPVVLPAPPDPTKEPEPLRLYDEFFGLPRDAQRTRVKALELLQPLLEPYELQFMVALVPDPIDSQLPAAFDQAIDAIQQGFAYSNSGRKPYLPDRSFIPWNDDQAVKDKTYQTSPGLLLFRRWRHLPDGREERRLMGVFLVGETPKTGIQKGAFSEALRLIEDLRKQSAAPGDTSPVKILGPTFSGSAVSLRAALWNWYHPPKAAPPPTPRAGAAPATPSVGAAPTTRFLIVTGSARAPCLESLFLGLSEPPTVDFYRAEVPLDVLLHTALEDLRENMGWDLSKTVLITELDTAFGQSVQSEQSAEPGQGAQQAQSAEPGQGAQQAQSGEPGPNAQQAKAAEPNAKQAKRAEPGQGAQQAQSAEPGPNAKQAGSATPRGCQPLPVPVGVVRFPSHIATIRTARAAAGLDKAPPPDPNQIGSHTPSADLQLNLANRPGADLVPDFSPLTAPANQIAIAGLVDAMARDGIRYVGILATDVRDTMFLADRIRSLTRNVTLFALEADQLFLHPQVHAAVNGMTVLSSSPLLISGRLWGDGAAVRGQLPWQLASTGEFGIFQAVVELTSDQPLKLVAADDLGPVWISVVGSDAIWPIRGKMSKSAGDPQPELVLSFEKLVRLETGAAGCDLAPASQLALRTDIAGADPELLLFVVLLCFGAWCLHRAALLPAPPHEAHAEKGTRRLLAAGLAALTLAGGVLVALALLPLWGQDHAQPASRALPQWLGFTGLSLAYVFLIAALVYGVAVRRSRRGSRRRSWGAAVGVLLAGLAAVPATAWAICNWWMPCGVAFDQRIRAFTSGLSPLISLAWLVGALYLWAFLELKRRRLTAWQQIDWPLADAFEPAFKGSSRLLGTIRWLLAATFLRTRRRQVALGAVVVLWLGLVWVPMQPAAEAPGFGHLILVLWTVPAVLSAVSCYRFVRVWQTLRKLLVRIESTTLASGLAALSQDLRWKPMQALTWPIPPFETLILSLVRLKALINAGTVTLNPTQVSDLDRFLGLAFKAEAREKARVEIVNRGRLERLIATVGVQLAAHRDADEVKEFFAIRVAAYLRYVFAQLRSSLMSTLGPALLVMFSVAAYTFEPKGTVSLGLLTLVLAEIAVAISIFVAMNRDTVLSLIAGNPPGQVTFDFHFVSSLITFAVLPLLALLGTQIPAVGELLNSWLKPLLHLAGIA